MMRLALIADIHGNFISLNTVLEEIEGCGVDQIICLGDVAATGPQPRECIIRVGELNCPVIMGNTDEWLLAPQMTTNADERTAQIEEIDLWCAGQLGENERALLSQFTHIYTIALSENISLLAYHGSPRSNVEAIHPDLPDEQILEMFSGHAETIMAGGHTHNQMMRHVRHKIVVNCGSVGLPFEKDAGGNYFTPEWAEFALVDCYAGRVSIELRRAPVDNAAIIAAIQASEMPHKEFLLAGRTPAN